MFIEETAQVSVDLTFSHVEGDLDVTLKSGDGMRLPNSVSVTDNELILGCIMPGMYFINVWSSNQRSTYLMRCPSTCVHVWMTQESARDDGFDVATHVKSGDEVADAKFVN